MPKLDFDFWHFWIYVHVFRKNVDFFMSDQILNEFIEIGCKNKIASWNRNENKQQQKPK